MEEEEEEEEECSTWAATTCSPVAGQPGTGHCPRAPTPAFQSLARFAQHYRAPTKYYIAPHCIKYLTLHFVIPYCIAPHHKFIQNHTALYMRTHNYILLHHNQITFKFITYHYHIHYTSMPINESLVVCYYIESHSLLQNVQKYKYCKDKKFATIDEQSRHKNHLAHSPTVCVLQGPARVGF